MKIATREKSNRDMIPVFKAGLYAVGLVTGMTVFLAPAFAVDAPITGSALPAISAPALSQGSGTAMPTMAPSGNSNSSFQSASAASMPPSDAAGTAPGSPNEMGGMPENKTADNSVALEKKAEKNISKLEDHVTDNAKDVVKKLGASSTDITLDDLNAAKIAVAKIDALIDIEKHLADLDKIRDERKKNSSVSSPPVIPQITMSSIQPPPVPMPMPVLTRAMPPPSDTDVPRPAPVSYHSDIDVQRVVGVGGHYEAVLALSGGQTKTVHVGDKLSDGSLVTGISSDSVTVSQQGKTHEYEVKGVDKIYGRSL